MSTPHGVSRSSEAATMHALRMHSRSGGSVVEDPAARDERRRDAHHVFFVVEPDGRALHELGGQIEAGELRPVVGEVRPLAGGSLAFAAKASGGILGKSVLRVAR